MGKLVSLGKRYISEKNGKLRDRKIIFLSSYDMILSKR